MQIGFIGLGKMGSRMVEKLLTEGHEVVVWNRSKNVMDTFVDSMMGKKLDKRLTTAHSVPALIGRLSMPRVIWSMLPAGEPTENVMKEIASFVMKNDIVIDGGNAHFSDTEKRFKEFTKKGVKFLGIGVSGGIVASTQGYPLMVGGDEGAYVYIKPLLESLAKPNGGYEFVGEGGAGHFVKMVHNAIEYGYMQAIGEGFGVLEKSPYDFDLAAVAQLYRKNTLISGFMMDRTEEALLHDPALENLTGIIAESGEAKWTIDEAKKHKLPIPVIEKSLDFRKESQNNLAIQKSFAARMVAALRAAFGGHEVRKN